jgi:hypothetical protein
MAAKTVDHPIPSELYKPYYRQLPEQHFFKNKSETINIDHFAFCGEYRGRTDDLLHAMQAL